jgi:transcription termination factor NusB
VAINEAVELAKRYGAAESFKFINAVMDRASRDIKRDDAKANA